MQVAVKPDSPVFDDAALASLFKSPADFTNELSVVSQTTGLVLQAGRDWHVISNGRDGIVLRLVERGDLIAQCNVSRLHDLPAGKQIGLEELQRDIRKTLRTRFAQFEHAEMERSKTGRRILRVTALGDVDAVPIRWIYHHLSTESGERAAFVFTLEDEMVTRFAASDQSLVESLQFRQPLAPRKAKADVAAAPAESASLK